MRQLLSTALVALIVGSLAGVTVSTLAQEPAQTPQEDEAVVTAGLNADTVDGRHAVKATSKKTQRRNKLVAADAKGYLPSNIVKPKWGLISEKPPGFADGVDNVGYASATQPTVYGLPAYTAPGTGTALVYADAPLGVDVEIFIVPAPGASIMAWEDTMERGPRASYYDPTLPPVPDQTIRRIYFLENNDAVATTFRVRTRVYDTGIAPAALKTAAKQLDVNAVKLPKRVARTIQRRTGR